MKITSKIKNYHLIFIDNILDSHEKAFGDFKHGRLVYFIDRKVYELYKNKIEKFVGISPVVLIPADEREKSYLKIAKYYRKLIELKFTREDTLVTIGGGILQDISGFIASTLYRGVKWVFIPTTLLSQADSCIGSKTSINFDNSKNLIGTFYPPDYIFNDLTFSKTLTNGYFNSGIGEIIKFHLMSDAKGYALLQKYLSCPDLRKNKYFTKIVHSTLNIKYSYFQGDEFDSGRRNLLNYGHCFGHALESASNFTICHGEAVIVGMGFANLVSLKRGLMSKEKYDEFEVIFQKFYPKFNLADIKVNEIIYYLRKDKKRIGKDLTMILSCDIGKQVKVNDLKEKEIKSAYNIFVNRYQKIISED